MGSILHDVGSLRIIFLTQPAVATARSAGEEYISFG